MRIGFRYLSLAAICLVANIAFGQTPETPTTNDDTMPDPNTMPTTTSPTTTDPGKATKPNSAPTAPPSKKTNIPIEEAKRKNATPPDADRPMDGVVEKKTVLEKQVLAYDPIREADVLWEKRIWRVIDIREKLNQAFGYPEQPFINILLKGIQQDSAIKAYSTEDDKFSHKISAKDIDNMLSTSDTVNVPDPITGDLKLKIVHNDFNPEDIKRYRLKELWFFDKQASILKVRILGIAPLKDVKDDAGNFLYEQPLFWVYYPDCREYFARFPVFMDGNDANPTSWDDLFDTRHFSSYIFKESNVQNRRMQDYLTGVDILLEGEKIKQEIFNWEHDLWSY